MEHKTINYRASWINLDFIRSQIACFNSFNIALVLIGFRDSISHMMQ